MTKSVCRSFPSVQIPVVVSGKTVLCFIARKESTVRPSLNLEFPGVAVPTSLYMYHLLNNPCGVALTGTLTTIDAISQIFQIAIRYAAALQVPDMVSHNAYIHFRMKVRFGAALDVMIDRAKHYPSFRANGLTSILVSCRSRASAITALLAPTSKQFTPPPKQ